MAQGLGLLTLCMRVQDLVCCIPHTLCNAANRAGLGHSDGVPRRQAHSWGILRSLLWESMAMAAQGIGRRAGYMAYSYMCVVLSKSSCMLLYFGSAATWITVPSECRCR